MKLTEWLQNKGKNENVTFIIAKVVEDENSPSYHYEYVTTPIRTAWEWLESNAGEKYIILNKDHAPIDITGVWNNWYIKGHLRCAIVTTEQDMFTLYNEEQALQMIKHYDNEARN